jgi:hypothetical protein
MRPYRRWPILAVLAGVTCATVMAASAAPASAVVLPTIHDRTLAPIGARAYAQNKWAQSTRLRVVTELAAAGSESCTNALRAGLPSARPCLDHLRNVLVRSWLLANEGDARTLLNWAHAYALGLYNRLAAKDPTFLTPAKGKLLSTTRGWKALQLLKRGSVWAAHSFPLPFGTPVPGSHVNPQPAGALNFWTRAWGYMT